MTNKQVDYNKIKPWLERTLNARQISCRLENTNDSRTLARVAVALGLYTAGALTGYVLRDCQSSGSETEAVTSKNQAICDSVTSVHLKQFNQSCTKENYEGGTLLREIRENWAGTREANGCEPQKWSWVCSPKDPSDSENSEYEVRVRSY